MPDLSFKEKSILTTLVGVSVIAAWYFWTVMEMLAADAVNLVALGKLAVFLTIFFIVVEVVFHAVMAVWAPRESREESDERDRLIELKADRIAGLLLGIGVAFTVGHIGLNALFGSPSNSPFITANLLLFFLTVAEIAKYVSQLVFYRRGV